MSKKISVNSSAEALDYIEQHEDELKVDKTDTLFFRGETKLYPTMLPSLLRQPKDKQIIIGVLIQNFAEYLLEEYLPTFVEIKAGGPFYKGKWVGRSDWAHEFRAEPEFLDAYWQLQGVLQHYGWPTPWLDITFDPKAAIFFGSFDFTDQKFISDGYGYLHIWSKKATRVGHLIYDTPIVDLKPISDVLSDVLNIPSTRPRAQSAAAIRIAHGNKHAEDVLQELKTTIAFKRHDASRETENLEYYFPADPLLDQLHKIEETYIKTCESVPEEWVDESWLEYLAFVSQWRQRCI